MSVIFHSQNKPVDKVDELGGASGPRKSQKRVNVYIHLWQSFSRHTGVSDWGEIPSQEQKHLRMCLHLRPLYGKGLSGAFPAKRGIY